MRLFYCKKCSTKTRADKSVWFLICDCGTMLMQDGLLTENALEFLGYLGKNKPFVSQGMLFNKATRQQYFELKYPTKEARL